MPWRLKSGARSESEARRAGRREGRGAWNYLLATARSAGTLGEQSNLNVCWMKFQIWTIADFYINLQYDTTVLPKDLASVMCV